MTYEEGLLRQTLYRMVEEDAANALIQKDAQAISETLGGDQSLYVAAWANYSLDDFVSLWCATCLSVGVKHDHKAVSSEDFAKKVVELGSAAGHDFKALKEVIRRYKNVRLNADIADSGLKLNRHKKIELSEFMNWAARKNWEWPKGLRGTPTPLLSTDQPKLIPLNPELVSDEIASDGVETRKAGPLPLTTNEIASCFDGFRDWDVKRWKRELGSPDNWLRDCQHSKGTQGKGGHESTWWPVKIALALASKDQKSARHLPARFKRVEQLKPWLEELENNIPDNSGIL